MNFWNSVYLFFSENIIVLSIVLVLTVTVTVLEKTNAIVKLFTAIKNKIFLKKESQKKQAEQIEIISSSIQQINVKIDELSTELKSEIDSVRNELISYVEEDGNRHNEILDAIKQLEQGNAYCLGEMIRRIYLENESIKQITERDYDILKKAYTLYHERFGGNGPIQKMMETIENTWEILYEKI